MEQYIKKSAIVAEIRRYIKSAEAFLKYHHNKKDRLCYSLEHQRLTMCELLSFLDTLDVKDVDLEAIVEEAFDKYSSVDGYGQLVASFNRAELYSFVKKIARGGE